MTETVTEALNEARLFIEAEYADPAAAVDGERQQRGGGYARILRGYHGMADAGQ